ncbi:MAG: adhesin HecA-like repeat protein [Bacteroidia bacterium]|jgi:adhesin HecA-like repeat protein
MISQLRKTSLISALCIIVPFVTFAQFQVVNNGALTTVNTGCIVTIKTGDLINSGGTIDNAGRITVEGDLVNEDEISGGGLATGIFNVQDDWENNGVFTADQSMVNLIGGAQNIQGTAVSSFYNLTLVGPGIKTLTLNSEVQNVLNLTDQELNTDVNKMELTSTLPSALDYNNGFVSGEGAGRLVWNTNSMSDYVFQVGSSSGTLRVRPVTITPNSIDPNKFEVRMANVNPSVEGFNTSLTNLDICDVNDAFYHLIERTTGTSDADIAIHYLSAQDGSWDRELHWQNVPQWENMPGATASISGIYDVMTTPAWSDFSLPAFGLGYTNPDVSLTTLNTATCELGSPITLDGAPLGGSYSGNGVSGAIFSPASAGLGWHPVTYSFTDLNGCAGEETQIIEVYAQPAVALTTNGDLELCDGDELTISASPGFANYEWNTTENTESITITDEGAYSVVVTDTNGCEGISATANVTVHPVPYPTVSANGPLEFCEGGIIELTASQGFSSYSWSNMSNDESIDITQSGTYTVTVTNQYLCQGTSEDVEVNVIPVITGTIFTASDTLWVDPPGSNYQWSLNGSPIPGAVNETYVAESSGAYTVEYVGDNGCPTESYILEFTLTIGVEEDNIFSHLDVYPNPGKGKFVIDAEFSSHYDIEISFTDMVGRKVAENARIGRSDQFRTEVDFSEMANGVYFINIMVGQNRATVRYVKS